MDGGGVSSKLACALASIGRDSLGWFFRGWVVGVMGGVSCDTSAVAAIVLDMGLWIEVPIAALG